MVFKNVNNSDNKQIQKHIKDQQSSEIEKLENTVKRLHLQNLEKNLEISR